MPPSRAITTPKIVTVSQRRRGRDAVEAPDDALGGWEAGFLSEGWSLIARSALAGYGKVRLAEVRQQDAL